MVRTHTPKNLKNNNLQQQPLLLIRGSMLLLLHRIHEFLAAACLHHGHAPSHTLQELLLQWCKAHVKNNKLHNDDDNDPDMPTTTMVATTTPLPP